MLKPKELYTTSDAAELLSISIQTLMGWIHEGKIEYYKIGHRYRISRETIERLLSPHNEQS